MRVRFSHHIFRIEPYGGVSRYFTELHTGLLARGVDSRVIAPLHMNEFLGTVSGAPGLNVGALRPRAARQALTKVVDHWWARFASRQLTDTDVVHMTYFDTRLPTKGHLVTTVYDMVHELFPHEVGPRDATIEMKRHTCEHADLILTISERTRTDLLDRYGLPAERVVVTPLGVRPLAVASSPPVHDRPFVLYVGDRRRPYKNFQAFVQSAAPSLLAHEVDLVCFGGGRFDTEEQALLARWKLTDRAFHERGDDHVLARFYSAAVALVYPSLYEGFGLPPIEAMAYGCPVAAAAAGAIPEIAGSAAVLFDPTDPDEMAAAIERVIADDALRASLVAKGREQSNGYTWANTVDRTLAAYDQVLADRSGRR